MAILKTLIFISLFTPLTLKTIAASELSGQEVDKLKVIHLSPDKSKNKKLYYFWASWCPDCRGKLRGELKDLKKERSDIEIVTVNVDRKQAKGEHFIKEESLPFPVVRDEEKFLRKNLKVFSVPSWAVLEKNGANWKVTKVSGGSNMSEIKSALGAKIKNKSGEKL